VALLNVMSPATLNGNTAPAGIIHHSEETSAYNVGWELGLLENSGAATLSFRVAVGNNADANLTTSIPEQVPSLVIARFNGTTKNLARYDLSGALTNAVSGPAAAVGPIYYNTTTRGAIGYGYTNNRANAYLYGLLVYDRDIGQDLANLFGETGTCGGIALPFVPRRRVSFSTSSSLRVTRQAAEALSTNVGSARVSRQMMEILAGEVSALCVTRQAFEVIGYPSGSARVSRQMVEALATTMIWTDTATDTLSLSETYAESSGVPVSGNDTLTLTDSTGVVSTRQLGTHDQLTLAESLTARWPKVVAASDTLTLSEATVFGKIWTVGSFDAISFSEQEKSVGPRLIGLADTLALSETLYRPVSAAVSCADVVLLSDTIRSNLSETAFGDSCVFAESFDTRIRSRTLSDRLQLTEVFNDSGWVGASDKLAFAESFNLQHITVSTTDRLTFAEGWHSVAPALACRDSLAFTESWRSSARIVTCSDVIFLVETPAFKSPGYVACSDALQTVSYALDPVTLTSVETITGLQDTFTATRLHAETQFDALALADSFSAYLLKVAAKEVSCGDTIALTEDCRRTKTGNFPDFLALTDSFSASICKWAADSLAFAEELTVMRSGALTCSDSLDYSERVLPFKIDGDILYRYSPAGVLDPLNASLSGVTTTFQLLFPATGTVTDSVILRAPNLGNKDRLSFNRVLRETRGGTLIVYADPMWPKIERLVLSFSGLQRAETQQLLAFFANHLGVEVGLLDWEQRCWQGLIMTPEAPVVEDTRGRFSASFEFEGVLNTAWTVQNLQTA